MSIKKRIRTELDKGSGYEIDKVVNTIINEGVSDDELREILPDVVRTIAKLRLPGAFFSGTTAETTPTTSSGQPVDLLPRPKQPFIPSTKVQSYQNTRLDEMYPVGKGKFKRLSEMTKVDIEHNIDLLQAKIDTYVGRKIGWTNILDKMTEHKVDIVDKLPDSVKQGI